MGLFDKKETLEAQEKLKHEIKRNGPGYYERALAEVEREISDLRKLKSNTNSQEVHSHNYTTEARLRVTAAIEYKIVLANKRRAEIKAKLKAAQELDSGKVSTYKEGSVLVTTAEAIKNAAETAEQSKKYIVGDHAKRGGFKGVRKKKISAFLDQSYTMFRGVDISSPSRAIPQMTENLKSAQRVLQ